MERLSDTIVITETELTTSWPRALLVRLFWLTLICLPVGLLTGHIAWTLVFGLVVYVSWMLRQLLRFHSWLADSRAGELPDVRGLWGEIFSTIHRQRQAAERRQQRLQRVIDQIQNSTAALSEAVVMIDRQGRLEWWNPSADRLLGLRNPADKGQHVTSLIRDPRFVTYYETGAHSEPLNLDSPTSTNIHLQFAITRYGQGERLMIVRDITRLHNLELMRKDFVANVSHELRTPLTVVIGYLETLLDDEEVLASRWRRPMLQMQQQASRMHTLLNDLLLLSRLETTDTTPDEEPVLVHVLLSRIRDDALAFSNERHHRITLSIETEQPLAGIAGELRSAFSNLVFNAVKYTPDGAAIQIRWWSDEAGAHMSVTDDGPGIAPEHLSRLTERFYRIDSSRNSHTGGSGLGLAIVKHVLLRHQGRLEIVSEEGKGSCFTCHFPAKRLVQRVQALGE
ncbi:phosphate regulon sensor histidine kinase PhoR [Pseudomonas saliphila]|uniref:phosphate regulon sensor histidine kinase PhoR n=1 Tax=Pseudomonas saliphila TaxID=2586906 RepID=UPI001238A59E|nr:phosphate regulon sensor histidine kinase PhoR [Pseudomonas saliphila]